VRQRSVVVAVIAVRVMKAVVHHVIEVVAMRHRLMPTIGAVLMGHIVPGCSLRVLRRMLVVDIKRMLVDVAVVQMMQMPVVQIVDVIAMAHRDVPAARAVGVRVILVCLTGHDSQRYRLPARKTNPREKPRSARHSDGPGR
jgi:hypothetical protein